MRTLHNCCCCFTLQTGCIIIGAINLVATAALFAWNLLDATYWRRYMVDPYGEKIGRLVETLYSLSFGITGLCSILLIVGALRRLCYLLTPWLMNCLICIGWCIVEFALGCTLFEEQVYVGLQMAVRSFVAFGLSVFFGWVVYSFYSKLKHPRPVASRKRKTQMATTESLL